MIKQTFSIWIHSCWDYSAQSSYLTYADVDVLALTYDIK